MQIAIDTPPRKIALAVGATVLAMAYVSFAMTRFLGAWFGSHADLANLQRAVWFDPGNAEFQDHLGRYYALVLSDASAAIAHYKSAVELNPHSARYWFDLASAYQVLGDPANQSVALDRAIQADPTTPDFAWEAANFYLVRGQIAKALHEYGVTMIADPSLGDWAIGVCWRIKPDVDALLRDVVPPHSDAYISFLKLLLSKQETMGAARVWAALMQTGESFEPQYAFDYFNYLIGHKEVDQAVLVWRQAANRLGLTSYLPSSENLMVNGNFEFDVLNRGFDWRYERQSGVDMVLDPSEFHSGRRSLLISFDGPGITDAGVYEFVPVHPNTKYEFSAYYKNSEIEGAGGPHITIQDMYAPPTTYYDSDDLKDADYWKLASADFTTGADTRLLLVHIRRIPEGSPIRGKLWIDDFRLAEKRQ